VTRNGLLPHTRSASRNIRLCLNSTPHQHSGPDNCDLSLAFSFTHSGCTFPIIVGQRLLSIVSRPRVFSERDKSRTLNADVHLMFIPRPWVTSGGKVRSSRLNNAGRGRYISLPGALLMPTACKSAPFGIEVTWLRLQPSRQPTLDAKVIHRIAELEFELLSILTTTMAMICRLLHPCTF